MTKNVINITNNQKLKPKQGLASKMLELSWSQRQKISVNEKAETWDPHVLVGTQISTTITENTDVPPKTKITYSSTQLVGIQGLKKSMSQGYFTAAATLFTAVEMI